MNNFYLSIIISFLSGFSTMLGIIPIYFKNNNQNTIIRNSLILSSFVMILVAIFDLIPNSFMYISTAYSYTVSVMIITFYIFLGFVIVEIINDFNKSKDNLYKIGIISMIAMIIHNFPEGIITFITTTKNMKLGLRLSLSIALHNIPEGIAIAIPIYYSTKNKIKAFNYTLIAALEEPIGAIIGAIFLKNINDYLFGFILSITAGIMIYLAIFEQMKESREYKNKRSFI